MTHTAIPSPSLRRKPLSGLVLAALDRLLLWQRQRAGIRRLQALDDRALKDIGIDRSEIRSAALGRR